MIANLSLRGRLLALYAGLLGGGLAIGLGALVFSAGPRVRAEADSAMRLSRDFVQAALAGIPKGSGAKEALDRLLGDFSNLRHVTIYLEGAGSQPSRPAAQSAPEWFQRLILAKSNKTRIALDFVGRQAEALIIETNPQDEVAEVWDDFKELALGGILIALAGYFLIGVLVSRSLRPVATVSSGIRRLEQGFYDVRLAAEGPSDFVDMSQRLNALSVRLRELESENRQLGRRIVQVQDEERREIARNLHDEFGPSLFAIRANLATLARQPQDGGPPRAGAAREIAELSNLVVGLQHINRRILGQLRPAALAEFGIVGALESLVANWRQTVDHVDVSIDFHSRLDDIDETIGLTVYRIVQEALTNVARHAGATKASVELSRRDDRLWIVIEDDGAGFEPNLSRGLGLKGMSERITALGGTLKLTSAAGGGAQVRADLPAHAT